MGLSSVFLKESSAVALTALLCLKLTSSSGTRRKNEGLMTTYAEVVKNLLQTDATNDFIAKTDFNLTGYNEPWTMPRTQYEVALVPSSLKSPTIFEIGNLPWLAKDFFKYGKRHQDKGQCPIAYRSADDKRYRRDVSCILSSIGTRAGYARYERIQISLNRSVPFCRVCLSMPHRQAYYPFILNHLRE